MKMSIYKNYLILLCAHIFVCTNIFSMNPMQKFEEDLKTANEQNIKALAHTAAELAKDKKNYYAIVRLTHPDKTSNKLFEEIARAAIDAYSEQNRPKTELIPASAVDRKRIKILKKTDKIELQTQLTKECSIGLATAAETFSEGTQAVSQNFVDGTIHVLFTLISDKLPITEDSPLQNDLNILKDRQEKMKDALDMHDAYRNDLNQAQIRSNNIARALLKKHINKGKL